MRSCALYAAGGGITADPGVRHAFPPPAAELAAAGIHVLYSDYRVSACGLSSLHRGPMTTSSSFKFVFSSVRIPGSELQLQEVRLYANGDRLSGMTASNPGGSSPAAQPPSDAVDNDLGFLDSCEPTCCTYTTAPCTAHNNIHLTDCGCTTTGPVCTCSHGSKWLDQNMALANSVDSGPEAYSSTLVLSFATPQTVTAYELITADDNDKRDPTAWTFYAKLDDTWVPYKAEQVQSPPQLRYTSYGISSIPTTPLPEGSHADPLVPVYTEPAASAVAAPALLASGSGMSPVAVALASSLSTAAVVLLAVYCYWTRRIKPMVRMYDEGLEIEQMQPMRADVYPLSHADVYPGATSGNGGALEFATAADEHVSAAPAADERDEDGQSTSL